MYVTIWEFHIRQEAAKEFESAYDAFGIWAALFKKGRGYIRTELLHDANDRNRYVTIDYWTSPEVYETFRKQYANEYKIIDLKCASFTVREVHLGSFTTV